MKKMFLLIVVSLVYAAPALAMHPDEYPTVADARAWAERVHINGTLESDYAWTEKSDLDDEESDNASDLSVGTLELGVEADLAEWIKAGIVLLGEDLGNEDETDVTIDEATMTFQNEQNPFYLVTGKRAQPFGVFENHLLTDPMTQDAYEVSTTGITAGVTGPLGLDFSATVYEGQPMMDHLFESGLFNGTTITRAEDPALNDVSSYIVSASISPIPHNLVLFASYLSEPGYDDRRNNTVGGGFSMAFEGLVGFRLDAEYIEATQREIYEGLDREYRERVYSISAAIDFMMRNRAVIGSGSYEERKDHTLSEPLEIAVRYEHFDDDGLADDTGTWSADERYSAGVRYSFYRDTKSGLSAYLGAEYRHTKYRVHENLPEQAGSHDEVFVRLGVTF